MIDINIYQQLAELISHSHDYGHKVSEESFRFMYIVEIHMQYNQKWVSITVGEDTKIDVNRPNRMKTYTCPLYFRRVLKLIQPPLTSMNSKDMYNHSRDA